MRLFVAVLPPPEAVRDLEAALAPLRDLPGAPRWTPPERWHITLAFLADVDDPLVERLSANIGAAAGQTRPPIVAAAGAGVFGSGRAARVAWVGVHGDERPLAQLARRVRAAARRSRADVARTPFRPHLTVGRWRPSDAVDTTIVERLADYRGPDFAVRDVALVRSRLGPQPRYEVLDSFGLRG